jgi:phosphoserine phosphatase
VDVNIVPAAFRRKRLLLADMDSTLIAQECIDELAVEAGSVAAVAAITEQAMRGEIGFEPALRARVALLRGLPTSSIEMLLRDRITLMAGAAALVTTMRLAGAYTALVSGGFTNFTGPIAARLGFDEHRANTLKEVNGELTGQVGEPVFGRSGKGEVLAELNGQAAVVHAETLAVGDGANDLAMLQGAGLGVAFRAKPALREVADAILDHADLTGLLFLQGYRRQEFAAGADQTP